MCGRASRSGQKSSTRVECLRIEPNRGRALAQELMEAEVSELMSPCAMCRCVAAGARMAPYGLGSG